MNTLRPLFVSLAACLFFFSASVAQDCAQFYFLQNNKTITMASFNKKGNETARQVYKVTNVQQDGSAVTAELATELFDKKGKSVATSNSTVRCENGVMLMDMKMSIPTQQNEQFANTDVKVDNFYIRYPSSMKVGDQLENATMHMEMNTGTGVTQTMDMEVTERKVEGQESVTTTAGTWDCFKISFKSRTRIKTMGIGIPVNVDGVEWFAPGFGIVKTESKGSSTAIVDIK